MTSLNRSSKMIFAGAVILAATLITFSNALAGAIIVDHRCVDIRKIPESAINMAKSTLHIGYGHTSHGSQLTTGMNGLVDFANGGGKGLSLPEDIFAWSHDDQTPGKLHLFEGASYGSGYLELDCGYWPTWRDETIEYLGDPDPVTGRGQNQPDCNVIIWSWCGQASSRTEQTMIDTYLEPMTQLEAQYPGVTFVYMTGHLNGSGLDGNLHQRNEQIRDYCKANGKVLFDFADIETYDPEKVYFGDKHPTDACNYDYNNDGSTSESGGLPINGDRNWAIDWQDSHTVDFDWYSCSAAHTQPLNANQKAYAAWWLWARLAGWPGPGAGLTGAKTLLLLGN